MLKTLNGRPTKKAIRELCEQHGLLIYALDTYSGLGHIIFGERKGANEKAKVVADVLQAEGYTVTVREADRNKAMTGCIAVKPKDK